MRGSKPEEEKSSKVIPLHVVILEDRKSQGEEITSVIKNSLESISRQTGIGYSLNKVDLTDDPNQVHDIMNNENGLPDWVLCDLDLKIEGAGKKVAKWISSELFPTDVLLYTYAGLINDPDPLPENRYGATLMANRDEIDGRISWLMWKTLVKLSDPEYTRGLLLSRATDTESLLDECLSYIFRIREEQAESFRWRLLRGEGYNWNHKYKVLESELSQDIKSKLSENGIKMDKIYGHLNGIFTFRNDIAHGILRGDKEGGLYIRNRSSSSRPSDSSQDRKTRKDIKKQLSLCHKAERELSSVLSLLKEWANSS